jgi:hypothetical protein
MRLKMSLDYKKVSLFITPLLLLFFSGCAGGVANLKEIVVSATEKPSVEKPLNRAKLGINILRTNSDILYNMPISADAEWVDKLSAELTEIRKDELERKYISKDPFYGTVRVTDAFMGENTSPTDNVYNFYNRVDILYVKEPDMEELPGLELKKYREFTDAKLVQVEAINSSLYSNIGEAVISMTPDRFQDDLREARSEMEVASYNSIEKKGEIEKLEAKKMDTSVQEVELERLEKEEERREEAYFLLMERATEELKAEISLDNGKIALAKKLKSALEIVFAGANSANTLFLNASAKLGIYGLKPMQKELSILDSVKRTYAVRLTDKAQKVVRLLEKRVEAIKDNATYLFPYVGIGSYYAFKQKNLASKYEDIVNTIIEVYEIEQRQDRSSL